jgi:hypothetical protein
MNTRTFLIAIAFTAGLFFTSCEKDDETNPKPVITLTELGYENSKIGYAGTDLHIEATILAEGKVDKVIIEIHPEGEHEGEHEEEHEHGEEWEFDSTFTEFSGIIDPAFHKHIDIPVDADTGHYHFHFIVIDMEGQQTTVEEELEIQQPSDDEAPEITVSSAPTNGQTFANGETITVSGSVSDDLALGGMYIGLVRTDQNLTDAEVNAMNTITLLHTHEFDSHTAHNFSASINVGAAQDNNITPKDITGDIAWQSGNYYIVVKCKDAFGGNWTFSSHYPIVINY